MRVARQFFALVIFARVVVCHNRVQVRRRAVRLEVEVVLVLLSRRYLEEQAVHVLRAPVEALAPQLRADVFQVAQVVRAVVSVTRGYA